MSNIITIKLIGVKPLIKKIHLLKSAIPTFAENSVNKALQMIDEASMRYLYSTTINPATADSIDKRTRITTLQKTPNLYSAELVYYSKHSAIVEYGGLGKVLQASDFGIKSFPIGKSQYGVPTAFSPTIRLQEGKHYLQHGIDEVVNSGKLQQILQADLDRLISSIWK